MVGGTFGVAALGALVAAIGRHDLAKSLPQVPHDTREQLVDALGGRLPDATAQIRDASQQAFVDALGTGLTIAAFALLLAALVAWLMVNPQRPAAEVPVEAEALPDPEPAGTVA
jgi:hypothetical protein